MVELGRVDIITEVSCLASHLAMPRQGHMDAVYHIFGYLKGRHNARLVLDPTYPEVDETAFVKQNWDEFYGEIKEELPPGMIEPLGREVDLRLFVDSSHADDNEHDVLVVGTLFMLIWPQSLGFLESRLPLRHLSLVPNLLL